MILLTRTTNGGSLRTPVAATLDVGDYTMHSDDGRPCGGGDTNDADEYLADSCNTAFGYLALQEGPKQILTMAEKLGLTKQMKVSGLSVPGSLIVSPTASDGQIARTGIGQDEVRLSIPQQAELLTVVGSGGLAAPLHVVERVCGDTTWQYSAKPHRVVPAKAVTPVRSAMEAVTRYGTAKALAGLPDVYGKTGTAQVGRGWNVGHFIGGVTVGGRHLGLVVRVLPVPGKRHPSGPRSAVPVAKAVFTAITASGATAARPTCPS